MINNNIDVEKVICNLNKRKFQGVFVQNSAEALKKICELIPAKASVGFGGSITAEQIGIQKKLIEQGNKVYSFGFYQGDDLYEKAHLSDWYISSANAITQNGEIVNIDGRSNRISAITYGPRNVIIVAGINKLVENFDQAIDRIRNYTAPLNAIRLNRNTPCKTTGKCNYCNSPDCMCNNTLIMHHPSTGKMVYVILVNEQLGY